MIFSYRLQRAMEIRNISNKQLSQSSGINSTQISHFRSGDRYPSISNLVKIADCLHVSTEYLLGRQDVLTAYPIQHRIIGHFDKIKSLDYQEIAEEFLMYLASRESENAMVDI